MNDRIDPTVHTTRWALLPAVAAIALFAALPAAFADQQRSDEAPGYGLGRQLAGVGSGFAHAQAPAPVVRRHHRHAR